MKSINAHEGEIMSVKWGENGLWSGAMDKRLIKWDHELNQIQEYKFRSGIGRIQVTHKNRKEYIALSGRNNTDFITVWDSKTLYMPEYTIKGL